MEGLERTAREPAVVAGVGFTVAEEEGLANREAGAGEDLLTPTRVHWLSWIHLASGGRGRTI